MPDYTEIYEREDVKPVFDELRDENKKLREALEEVRACVDSLYDNNSPRRLHLELVKYAGFINVMDKVTFEALK